MSAEAGYAGRRVLVTGAGGFIGSHLCEALVAEGARVRALVRYNGRGDFGHLESLPEPTRAAIEVRAGDVRDARFVREAATGCERIFHLAALIGIPYSYAGIPQGVGALIALAACAVVGFVSGFIVVRLRVNSFIATLGMSQVLTALTLLLSGNRQISSAFSKAYRNIGLKRVFDLPLFFWFMIILAIVVWFVLEHTALGRFLFATGGNREAARLAGVQTDRYTWATLVVSAMIAGFAGLVQSWKVGTFGNNIGPGFLFPAIAAVFFGASQLRGRPNVWGTLIAVFTLAFGVKGLQLTFTGGNKPWIEPLFEGLSLLIAVAFASRQGIIKIPRRAKAAAPAAPATPG